MKTYADFFRSAFTFFCALSISIKAFAQTETGEIQGNVRDSVEAIFNAVIKIEGTNLGAVTDPEGNYVIKNVKPGTYKLIISYIGYPNKELNNVVVEPGKVTIADVIMQSDVVTKGPVQITVTKQSNTEEAAVKEVKESKQVINVISAEQISKSQDRDAAQVMARVPGVTVIENRFVMIRGLSERYNVVMINDIISPSTEAERRSFSFDLIPSAMIDRMAIYKSGGAEHPGDFAGGVIKIYTKNIPNKNYTAFALSTGYRSGTTFREFNKSVSGKTDFLGLEDGTRKLPDNFPKNLNDIQGTSAQVDERVEAAGKSLPDNFKYTTSNAMPDLRFNFDMGRKINVGESGKIGNVTSINYSNTYQYQLFKRADYDDFDVNVQKSPLRLRFD
ncbi:MAG: TonB-dependent receptor, partial [Cytophagaceae bacterium]|nr:TonB-dependent receptor [Cytophagaceae bacterium]MDW8457311.1 carboxypeptidase-like regulatory domain-containing protein [Cytophagaceae bacterium]